MYIFLVGAILFFAVVLGFICKALLDISFDLSVLKNLMNECLTHLESLEKEIKNGKSY